jgi:hypothetical protein
MSNRENPEAVESDRMIIELSIVAAILFVIVFASANAQLIKNNINCGAPYIGLFCKAAVK